MGVLKRFSVALNIFNVMGDSMKINRSYSSSSVSSVGTELTSADSTSCLKCSATIIRLQMEVDKLSHLAEEQAKIFNENTILYSISPWSLAIKRVPALLLTMTLELMGGIVIDQLHK